MLHSYEILISLTLFTLLLSIKINKYLGKGVYSSQQGEETYFLSQFRTYTKYCRLIYIIFLLYIKYYNLHHISTNVNEHSCKSK